ncbi:MAG TPA: coproporphyrinogen III oxidase [Cyanobacteria bacterium UBA8530]|nr:coproporphyrinogen III oxidase [Cyanobacteria bacterium UBA8530]
MREEPSGLNEEPIGLYLHFPFCLLKCRYCNFPSEAGCEELIEPYLAALFAEMEFYRGLEVRTVYLGGGTPSLLSPRQLEALFEALRRNFSLMPGREETIEINPATGSPSLWEKAREGGINRASIGAQSFSDRILEKLGRLHDSAAVGKTVEDLKKAGIDNFSLDLMYGLPEQTLEDWEETLEAALSLKPKHLSIYGLSIEEGTPFFRDRERLVLPEEETEVAMAEKAEEILSSAGFVHYEIASWALPGFESMHNRIYWRLEPYVGLGTGAHSYFRHQRYQHSPSIRDYLDHPLPLLPEAPLSKREEMEEFVFLGLRMLEEGISKRKFENRFGISLEAVFGKSIARLKERDLILQEGDRIRLNPLHFLLANEVFVEFV